jgi:hypothetical protein
MKSEHGRVMGFEADGCAVCFQQKLQGSWYDQVVYLP